MIFEVRAEQITRLTSDQFVMLMKRLLLAECQHVGIPLRAATVPLQITIADGGEDGRASWDGGVDSTDFFPSRFSIFQAKAQNLTVSSVTAEVAKQYGKGAKILNEAVAEVIRRNGAYIIFCSRPFTGQKIAKLCTAISLAIRKCRKSVPRSFKCDVYDANRIADWVNTHPSVGLWLTELGRSRSLVGFQSHDSWMRSPDIYQSKWVVSDDPRFAPGIVVDSSQRKDQLRNAWTFRQAVDFIHSFFGADGRALRIAGPSGFGKSRFAFELFNNRLHIADAIESAALLYADLRIVGKEALKLALEIADAGAPVILVVDECSDEQHNELVNCARRAGSRLCVVTIDVATRIASTADTLVVHLEPASDKIIAAIAKSVAPSISDSTARLIAQISHGFPRMAVLAAPQGGVGKQAIHSAEEVLERVIWGRRPVDAKALRALEFASLFEWLGLDGSVSSEAQLVAESFAQMSRDDFVEHVRSFADRGIVITTGDFIQIAPAPLAAALGSRRIAALTQDRLDSFWAIAPDRVRKSLLRRIKWLDGSVAAKAFANRLLAPTCLGNIAQFSTEFGSDCIDRLVHVDPDAAMAAIDNVLGRLDKNNVRVLGSGRRHLIWALEKLAFRRKTFVRAAKLLRRLSATETEPDISNNATGQFQQLFQLYLSGTEASPDLRLLVLDEGLASADMDEQKVCVGALERMLETRDFSRGGGAEEVGSQEPMEDWVPKTDAEIKAYLLAAVARLRFIAVGQGPFRGRARDMLASSLRNLISHLPLQEVKSMVLELSGGEVWTPAIHSVNSWLFYDRRDFPEQLQVEVREFFSELLPADPVMLALLYANSWPGDLSDPDRVYEASRADNGEFEYIETQLVSLAQLVSMSSAQVTAALELFSCAETKSAFSFARQLATIAAHPAKLFDQALSIVARGSAGANLDFFSGLVTGIEARDPKTAGTCVRKALRVQKFKDCAIALIGSKKLQSADINLVMSLVKSNDVTPRQCVSLSYGRRMEHLKPTELSPLIETLGSAGSDGMWAALEIAAMFFHCGKVPDEVMAKLVRSTLTSKDLFDSPSRATDAHHFKLLIATLARHGYLRKADVRGLTRQIIRLLRKENSRAYHAIGDSATTALSSLILVDGAEVWREIKSAAETNDWYLQNRLIHLVGSPRRDRLGSGPLFQLPSDLYLKWVRRSPQTRAQWIMKWLPLVSMSEADVISWHPSLLEFLNEFYDSPGVLPEVSARLNSTFWGPRGHELQPTLDLLSIWEGHPLSALRDFAHRQIEYFVREIADGSRREEEDIVRFS